VCRELLWVLPAAPSAVALAAWPLWAPRLLGAGAASQARVTNAAGPAAVGGEVPRS